MFEAACVSFGPSMPPLNGTVTVVSVGGANCVFVAVKVEGRLVMRVLDDELELEVVEVEVEDDDVEVVEVVVDAVVDVVVDVEVVEGVEAVEVVDVDNDELEDELAEDEDDGPLNGSDREIGKGLGG